MSHRKRLQTTRPSVTSHWTACGFNFYVTVGFFDGPDTPAEEAYRPGELFVRFEKRGNELSGLIDGIAVTASMALQHGVSWETLREKWSGTRFGREDVDQKATSLLDGLAQAVDECIRERRSILGV